MNEREKGDRTKERGNIERDRERVRDIGDRMKERRNIERERE